jgi:hypothetical protein
MLRQLLKGEQKLKNIKSNKKYKGYELQQRYKRLVKNEVALSQKLIVFHASQEIKNF